MADRTAPAAAAAPAPAEEAVKPDKLPVAAYFLFVETAAISFARFCLKSILNLFVRNKLKFSTDHAVSINHLMRTALFFLQPFGAMIVESVSNKYVILVVGGTITLFGRLMLALASHPNVRHIAIFLVGIVLVLHISVNFITGSALLAFRGDQFIIPDQQLALRKYFQYAYIVNNCCILAAYYMGPTLKTAVACLGEQDCYILGFSVSCIFYAMDVISIAAGKNYFRILKPKRNMLLDVTKCIIYSLGKWIALRHTEPKPHWLDYGEPKYGAQLVEDIRRVFRIMKVIAVLPLYYSVYYQLETKWVFQATRLNGRVGSYTIIPDYFQLFNPFLAVTMSPIMLKVLDPIIVKKWNMNRLLRRMIFGGSMVALSFVCCGIVETNVKRHAPVLPGDGEAQLRIYNGFDCEITIKPSDLINHTIGLPAHGVYTNKHIGVKGYQTLTITGKGSCTSFDGEEVYLEEHEATSILLKNQEGKASLDMHKEKVNRPDNGLPILTVIGPDPEDEIYVLDSHDVRLDFQEGYKFREDEKASLKAPRALQGIPRPYRLYWKGNKILEFEMHLGGIYLVMINGEESASLFTVTEPNQVHLLWLLIQSVLLIFGEVYLTISVNEFAYSEAPLSLKAFTVALNQLAIGTGECLIAVITLLVKTDQDYQFYFFALILFADMFLLLIIALRYVPVNPSIKLI